MEESIPNQFNLKKIEKVVILTVLKICKYNITKSASMLGITRRTLYRKIANHDIDSVEDYIEGIKVENGMKATLEWLLKKEERNGK